MPAVKGSGYGDQWEVAGVSDPYIFIYGQGSILAHI